MTGTWYPPAAGTGGFLLTNPPFTMTATDRHALSQPDPELLGATDQELMELMPEQFREDLATVSRMAAYGAGTGVTPGLFRVTLNTGALTFARAVLARWGRPALTDGPAVPDGREPASITWEPSDEELKTAYWEAYREAAMCGAEASWLAGLRAVARWAHHVPDASKMVSPAEWEVADTSS